jgi:chemotaxis protein histidine kinase CheA
MAEPSSTLIEILLTAGRTLALQLNDKLAVRVVHNAPLLVEWRGHGDDVPTTLQSVLEELLPSPQAGRILQQINTAAAGADEAGAALGTCQLRVQHGGGPDRFVALSLHRSAESVGTPLLLLMRDVTGTAGLHQSLTRTRRSLEAALAVLHGSPQAIRAFLTQALAAIERLRATMKLPARDQPSVHSKLAQLLEHAEQLGANATQAGIDTIAQACENLAGQLVALRDQQLVSGDELLVLAPLLDAVASSVGDCLQIEEQRHIPPTRSESATATTGGASRQPKKDKDWARSAERGWSALVRRIGEELGTLVKLHVQDARLVPPGLRRDVDNMLQHLLRNAVEHGIETPEQRLDADKPVSGDIVIRFRDLGRQGMTISVRDDGRGFDVERIGRAAVQSGVLSEESLLEYEPGEVVGLIFKPGFSTANLEGEAGRGRGMNYLRRAVARLGGQITVATKPGIYTRFVIQLPAAT